MHDIDTKIWVIDTKICMGVFRLSTCPIIHTDDGVARLGANLILILGPQIFTSVAHIICCVVCYVIIGSKSVVALQAGY